MEAAVEREVMGAVAEEGAVAEVLLITLQEREVQEVLAALGEEAQRLFTREAQRTDVFALAYPAGQGGCGSDWRHTPVMI